MLSLGTLQKNEKIQGVLGDEIRDHLASLDDKALFSELKHRY